MAMPQVLWLLLTLSLAASHMAPLLLVPSSATPCIRQCGGIDIPYPFGIGVECSWPGMDSGFSVTCNKSFDPPRAYLFGGDVEIINISVATSEMQIFSLPAYACYDSENTTESSRSTESWLNTTGTPFLISETQNVFTAVGCFAVAFLQGMDDMSYLTGCITTCRSLEKAANEAEKCTGLGCCQTPIHSNLSFVDVFWGDKATNPAWTYSPCNYGFVAQKDSYNFSRRDLNGSFRDRFGERKIPMVLDWAIRNNGSCKVGASGKLTAPACRSNHSECVDAKYGGGYICNCSKGYEGNPYMTDGEGGGCTNINECNSGTNDPCGLYSTCEDTDGDYNCKCNINHKGNGKSEEGCHGYYFPPYAIAATAILFVVVLGCILIIVYQRQRKRKRFTNNGGKVLRKKGMTIYTERDLKKITTSYRKLLGGGLFGNVYEGRIDGPPGQKVAVKRSVRTRRVPYLWKKLIGHEVAQTGQEEEDGSFINEIQFQFDAGHKNMVKLLGCCLETDIPILVFEFVSNGSLQDALHGASDKPCAISLLKRLDIAIGSAEALSYMHSLGNHKHVHGDIKPANILLDHDLNPKVSDFGSSKLLSVDCYYARAVAADRSYVDPIYMKTEHFTVKSDVYSFGMVLLELITRKTAIYDGNKSLPFEFVKCFRNNGTGRMMFDIDLFSGDDDTQSQRYMECLDRIAMLAVRCLMLDDVDKRPTMADVVEELKQVKVMATGGSSSSNVEAS